ncbi:MAG TPA: 50S ribosomal protein L9 [Alphaproteobacteria bacterium]|nr:50S ribosomal protein L9 [Alphaproteobacteria bacterium]
MQVILLENIHGLGQMGEEVAVKSGFGRNYLIPEGKALYATKDAKAKFEAQRAELEAKLAEARKEAEDFAKKFEEVSITLVRQSSETGQLFGSVKPQNIVDALAAKSIEIKRQNVQIGEPIKLVGEYEIKIVLHSDVTTSVKLNVERQSTVAIEA